MNQNYINKDKSLIFKIYLQSWRFVNSFLFLNFLVPLSFYRVILLKLFGARIGKNCIIKPNVKIYNPKNLFLGDNVWLGENTDLFTLNKITIENNVVLSQYVYLCTGSHDIKNNFKTVSGPITIKKNSWICTKSTILKDIVVPENSIIEACTLLKNNK